MQGFNMGRYMPPASLDASLSADKVGGFNSQKGHPLGARFSKAKIGIIKIRFEIPFDVWCETCQPEFLIKQGVRFNAEKKKIGNYLTTPIWEFCFNHPPCGGTVAIKTDPENTAYAVSSGGRKKAGAFTTALDKDYGEILTAEERERRRNDAFAHLEGQVQEKQQKSTDATRIKELYEAQDQHWEDPYSSNQRLRKTFRVGRKERETAETEKEAVSDRFGLSMELLDYTQEDQDRAAMVEFGDPNQESKALERALTRPLFATSPAHSPKKRPAGVPKKDWKKQQTVNTFQHEIVANTKAKINPFSVATDWTIPRKKHKHHEGRHDDLDIDVVPTSSSTREAPKAVEDVPMKTAKLVAYDDSESDRGHETPD